MKKIILAGHFLMNATSPPVIRLRPSIPVDNTFPYPLFLLRQVRHRVEVSDDAIPQDGITAFFRQVKQRSIPRFQTTI